MSGRRVPVPSGDAARFRDFWEGQAATYDAHIAWVEDRFLREGRRWVGQRAYSDVLEIAIGTGLTLPFYAPTTSITGIEWSTGMLDGARTRSASLGLAVTLDVGDAMHLPYADASFDTVVSTYAMCCIPDERATLTEAHRVLRPGGSLLLADHVAASALPVRLAQRVLDRLTVAAVGEHWTRRPYDLLPGLGFEVIESKRRMFGALEYVHAVRRP